MWARGTVKDFSKSSMKKWEEQVEQIVVELSQKYKEITVVAHSMGTLFAYMMAKKYPERVKNIMLLGTPLKISVKCTAFVNSIKSIFGLISDNDEVGKAYAKAHDELVSRKSEEFIPRKENISLTVLENSAHFIYNQEDFNVVLDKFKMILLR